MKNSLLLCAILVAIHGLQGKIIPETEFASPKELKAFFKRYPKGLIGSNKYVTREDEDTWYNTSNMLHTCDEALSAQNYKACENFLRIWNKAFPVTIDGYAFRIGKKLSAFEDKNPFLAQQSSIALNRTEALKESLSLSEEFSNSLESFYKKGRHYIPRHNGEKNERSVTRGLNIHEFWSLLHTCQSNADAQQEVRHHYDGSIKQMGCFTIEQFLADYEKHLSPEELAKIKPELHSVQKNIKQALVNKLEPHSKEADHIPGWVASLKEEIAELSK